MFYEYRGHGGRGRPGGVVGGVNKRQAAATAVVLVDSSIRQWTVKSHCLSPILHENLLTQDKCINSIKFNNSNK